MKVVIAALVVGVLSTAWATVGSAQTSPPSSTVWVLHGANLDGQENPSDGGSPVTLCEGTETLGQSAFGTLLSQFDATAGATLDLTVRPGDVDCAASGPDEPLGAATVTIEATGTLVVVTPDGDGGVTLVSVGVPAGCTASDEGRLVAVHAAPGAPAVQVDTAAASIGTIAFGQAAGVEIEAGRTATVEGQVLVDDTPVLDGLSIPVQAGSVGLIAVAGNPDGAAPTPLVALVGPLGVGICAEPPVLDGPPPSAPATTVPTRRPQPLSLTG